MRPGRLRARKAGGAHGAVWYDVRRFVVYDRGM